MIISTFKYFSKNSIAYVTINQFFLEKIKFLIFENYKSIKEFNAKNLKINYGTLKAEFTRFHYHNLPRLLKMVTPKKSKKNNLKHTIDKIIDLTDFILGSNFFLLSAELSEEVIGTLLFFKTKWLSGRY